MKLKLKLTQKHANLPLKLGVNCTNNEKKYTKELHKNVSFLKLINRGC